MKYVCDAPSGKTWFRIETEAEAETEARAMRHKVDKYFRNEWQAATASYQPTSLVRWERTSRQFRRYTSRDEIPDVIATSFAEDRHGCLFVGFEGGQLSRSCGGNFAPVGNVAGILAGGRSTGATELHCVCPCGTGA